MSSHTHPPLGRTAATLGTSVRPASTSPRRSTAFDRALATRVQRSIADSTVRLELWDRSSPYDASHPAIGDLVIHDRRALLGLAVNPDLYFGEAYMAGRLDVRGGLEPVVEALTRTTSPPTGWRARVARALALPRLEPHAPARAAAQPAVPLLLPPRAREAGAGHARAARQRRRRLRRVTFSSPA